MTPLSQLVERAQQGDREAFGGLYDRFARPLFLDLVGRLGSRDDAEDVLQASFLSVWTRLPTLRTPSRFAPWLFRVARNRATDALRQRRRRPTFSALSDDLLAPLGDGDGDDERVRKVVAAMKPESRALLLLRAVQGWSTEDVAKAWGLSAPTIRRRTARLRAHLERQLQLERTHA